MKQFTLLLAGLVLAAQLAAQTTQSISTGAGYQKQSYVNLLAGTEKQVNNTAWDIAFSVNGQQAGIFFNESAGTSMGQPQAEVDVFYALTEDFNEQPDPGSLTDFQLYNSEKSWTYGAFNEIRDTSNALDFGWGFYDDQSGKISGNALYVIKLRNDQYLKFTVDSLAGGIYTFRYANLDGSNVVTKTINKADHSGKTLAYFSFESGDVVDVEPASGGFDLLYCRYYTPYLVPGTTDYVPYNVTGVLSGPGVQVARANGIDPATVAYASYQDSLRSELYTIGYDWKILSGFSFVLDQDLVFFLKTADSRVWKLRFVGFSGSSSGNASIEKTDLGIISSVTDPVAIGMKALLYPNPVQDRLSVALDIPSGLGSQAQLYVTDLLGRTVAQQKVTLNEGFQVFDMAAQTWALGTYVVHLKLAGGEVNLGKVVKQ